MTRRSPNAIPCAPRSITRACALIGVALAAAFGPQQAAQATQPEPVPGSDQPSEARLAFANRQVAVYDFEEPTNPFEVPADFFRAQSDPAKGIDRPGYPVFNRASFDLAHARSGEQSVKLPIVRDSVSLRLRPGALPIFADADYAVEVFARSEGIEHARFRLVARLLDPAGREIDGAVWIGDPVLPGEAWEPVRLQIPGGFFPDAAFLQIDTEVVQPVVFQPPSLGGHQVWVEDFSGSVWIDDLTVTQLPRVLLRPSDDSGVFVRPANPELSLLVRDLTGEQLSATVITRDASGRELDRQTRPIRSSSEPGTWYPRVTAYGWYRAHVELRSDGVPITGTSCDFIVVPTPGAVTDAEGAYGAPDRKRFAFAADVWPTALLGVLNELGSRTRTHGLALGLWTADFTPEELAAVEPSLVRLMQSIDHPWARPTISLPASPEGLRGIDALEADQVLQVLNFDTERWAPYLESSLERLGEAVRRWRVGRLGTVPKPITGIPDAVGHIREEFAVLVPGPVIDVAWLPHMSFGPLRSARDLGRVTVFFEAGTGASIVGDTIKRFAEAGLSDDTRLTLAFGSAGSDAFAAQSGASELVKRIVEAEASQLSAELAGGFGYELVSPWSVNERDRFVEPHPELAAWRSTIDRLSGRSVSADLGFIPGVRVYLLTPDDPDSPVGGALVAWNESAHPADAAVELNLGSNAVTMVDMWGNRSAEVEMITRSVGQGREIGFHRIPVGRDPVFVEGIDVNLARFTASVRLDNPVLQATPGPHERTISVVNPWPVAIDGSAIVLEPAERLSNGRPTGWDITPRVRRFTVGPGESVEIPVEIVFSPVEPSGLKPFVVDLALTAGPVLERVRAASTLEIRLDGIEMDARIVEQSEGDAAALEVVVTNTTGDAVDLTIHAAARGYPRQSASVVQIPNGASVVRRFMYPGAAQRLRGQSVYVGVEEAERRGRLNRVIEF